MFPQRPAPNNLLSPVGSTSQDLLKQYHQLGTKHSKYIPIRFKSSPLGTGILESWNSLVILSLRCPGDVELLCVVLDEDVLSVPTGASLVGCAQASVPIRSGRSDPWE